MIHSENRSRAEQSRVIPLASSPTQWKRGKPGARLSENFRRRKELGGEEYSAPAPHKGSKRTSGVLAPVTADT